MPCDYRGIFTTVICWLYKTLFATFPKKYISWPIFHSYAMWSHWTWAENIGLIEFKPVELQQSETWVGECSETKQTNITKRKQINNNKQWETQQVQ